jgi:hypothetical protein
MRSTSVPPQGTLCSSFLCMFYCCFLLYVSGDTHMHIHVVTYIIMVLWIKLKLIMPNSLTIQKPNIRHFSVSGFAAVLKPSEPFDGTFYKDGIVR